MSIYISLKEAEDLVFNRILEIPIYRKNISKAQSIYSVSLEINEDFLIETNSNYIILFSAVLSFEIPEKDKSLFLLHFKLPEGLISTKTRLVRDKAPKEENLFDDTQTIISSDKFLLLRNAFVGTYNLTCLEIQNKTTITTVKEIFQDLVHSSNFKKELIFGLLEKGKYPIKEVKTEKFVTDRFYRAVWLLTIVKSNLLPESLEDMKKVEEVKKWMKDLLEIDDLSVINECLNNVPELFDEEINCLLGYYFATNRFEEFQNEKKGISQFISQLNYQHKEELFIWTTFFFSMFDEDLPYLHFSPLIQDEVYKIERIAFNLILKSNGNAEAVGLNFNRNHLQEDLISNYILLTRNEKNNSTKIIKEDELPSVVETVLFEKNHNNLGIEIARADHFDFLELNTCHVKQGRFCLNISENTYIKDVTFYVEDNSKCKSNLESLKIKRKPLEKLLSGKKVVLCFLYLDEFSTLIEIYYSILSKINGIEKVVIISLVNLEPNQVQSIEFDNKYRDYKARITEYLNQPCEFIVRNEKNTDSKEIRRNLRNAIGTYKTSQIEIVDENLSKEKISWVIESSTEYWIEKEGFNYYSIMTHL